MDLNIDLNKVPDESRRVEENATPTHLQHDRPGSTSIPPANAVDDEVTFLTATEWHAETGSHPRRRRSVRVPIDENLETNAEHSEVAVEEPIANIFSDFRDSEGLANWLTIDSLVLTRDNDVLTARSIPRRRLLRIPIDENMETNAEPSGVSVEEPIPIICSDCRNSESMINRMTSDSAILTNDSNFPTARDAKQFIPGASTSAPPSASSSTCAAAAATAADESGLICPICMNPMNEPSSTTCGHMFCSGCIEQAMRRQKKCPTCRKKLTKKNVHRIFLSFK